MDIRAQAQILEIDLDKRSITSVIRAQSGSPPSSFLFSCKTSDALAPPARMRFASPVVALRVAHQPRVKARSSAG
jgi:hypothetical protein